ncbi:hypothetical protein [Dongshaea marina]|uniref:hypothetical protein n=1 Tax=Dongshaea marina TaxID=2047966 RepID=UPI00131F0F04|nr:hypothetical protein [Dongshaea marina]
MKRTGFLSLISALCMGHSVAAEKPNDHWKSEFQVKQYSSQLVGDTLPYRLYTPHKRSKEKYPLVLFLHGTAERGSDNEAQLTSSVHEIFEYVRGHQDAYIIAPQCPNTS